MNRHRLLPAVGLSVAALAFAGCGDDNESNAGGGDSGSGLSGTISGAGASSQEAAQQAWIAGFQTANEQATVSYDPVGSGGGREQFVSSGVDFAGSDAALKEDELTKAQERCGGPDNLIEIPAYISPIAVIYNLDGVADLQLSPSTIAKIFDGKITKWDDAAIKADNPDAKLPSTAISPVHRSDESGTTENFTEYLAATAKSDWPHEASGDWPVKSGEAAQGTSGVVDAVKNGAGSIGYADASQAGDLGKAKVKVGEAFVAPEPAAAAKVIEESEETDDAGKHVFTYELNRTTTAAGTYPVVLVSYLIGCTKYDDANKASLVKGFFDYVISTDGQNKAAETAGSAPISDALRTKVQPAVDDIGAAS